MHVLSNKINYLYRTISPGITSHYLERFRSLQLRMLRHILSDEYVDFPIRATFPISKGGLGLGHQDAMCMSAYLASSISFVNYRNAIESPIPGTSQYLVDLDEVARVHLLKFRTQPSSTTPRPRTAHFDYFRALYKSRSGRDLQEAIYEDSMDFIIMTYEKNMEAHASKAFKQRYNSIKFQHAGKFLMAIPYSPATVLSDTAFRTALRSRLVLPHFPTDGPSVRCHCRYRTIIDPYGDHILTCNKSTKNFMVRHHTIVQCLSSMASQAGIVHKVEPQRSIFCSGLSAYGTIVPTVLY